jgi:transposase-like protein
MAQYNITVDDEVLKGLLTGDKGMSQLLEQVLNQVLKAQASEQLQAEPYERSEERQGYRNGTRPHPLTTRIGTLTLRVPRLRNGNFSTELFARYQRSEQALLLTLVEMVINGVSTRKISAITEELCGADFSKSTVSELCKRLAPVVQGWNERNLRDTRYPFVLVDAIVLKMREEGRVRSRAAMIATGINEEGYREIRGMMLGDSESEASWTEFFSWLKSRDLRGVDIVVSDNHRGLVKALQAQFQGATWQRCQPHLMRNFMDATPKPLHDELYGKVRAILDAPDVETARLLMNQVVSNYSEKAPKAIQVLENGFDDITAVLCLPARYRKRLRTTNGMERLNEEIRRRDRVIRIYPHRNSVIRLIGALLMERDEKWQSGHKYLDMKEYFAWREEQKKQAKQASKVSQLR